MPRDELKPKQLNRIPFFLFMTYILGNFNTNCTPWDIYHDGNIDKFWQVMHTGFTSWLGETEQQGWFLKNTIRDYQDLAKAGYWSALDRKDYFSIRPSKQFQDYIEVFRAYPHDHYKK